MKRLVDFLGSMIGLIFLGPFLLSVAFLVWRQDKHSPFYLAPRVGKSGHLFIMVKLRSMVVNADKTGVDSTSAKDPRITPVGMFIRRYKLDEFTQLWNVWKGDMSLVGPRPNVKRETDLYTPVEKRLLEVKPGITDFASIVFSDENEILADSKDPDVDYNQLIRPWKSRLGLFYIDHQSIWLDIRLIILTIIATLSRTHALAGIKRLLKRLGADQELIQVASRESTLIPTCPPGSDEIVTTRHKQKTE